MMKLLLCECLVLLLVCFTYGEQSMNTDDHAHAILNDYRQKRELLIPGIPRVHPASNIHKRSPPHGYYRGDLADELLGPGQPEDIGYGYQRLGPRHPHAFGGSMKKIEDLTGPAAELALLLEEANSNMENPQPQASLFRERERLINGKGSGLDVPALQEDNEYTADIYTPPQSIFRERQRNLNGKSNRLNLSAFQKRPHLDSDTLNQQLLTILNSVQEDEAQRADLRALQAYLESIGAYAGIPDTAKRSPVGKALGYLSPYTPTQYTKQKYRSNVGRKRLYPTIEDQIPFPRKRSAVALPYNEQFQNTPQQSTNMIVEDTKDSEEEYGPKVLEVASLHSGEYNENDLTDGGESRHIMKRNYQSEDEISLAMKKRFIFNRNQDDALKIRRKKKPTRNSNGTKEPNSIFDSEDPEHPGTVTTASGSPEATTVITH